MSDGKLIEAMARAIWEDCHGWFAMEWNIQPDDLTDTAIAALTAYRQHTADDGK